MSALMAIHKANWVVLRLLRHLAKRSITAPMNTRESRDATATANYLINKYGLKVFYTAVDALIAEEVGHDKAKVKAA